MILVIYFSSVHLDSFKQREKPVIVFWKQHFKVYPRHLPTEYDRPRLVLTLNTPFVNPLSCLSSSTPVSPGCRLFIRWKTFTSIVKGINLGTWDETEMSERAKKETDCGEKMSKHGLTVPSLVQH